MLIVKQKKKELWKCSQSCAEGSSESRQRRHENVLLRVLSLKSSATRAIILRVFNVAI